MKEIEIPVTLVKHVAEEKQIDKVYYIGLNLLLTWAILTFYKNYWACELVIAGTYVAHGSVLRCFRLLMTGLVPLGVLLTWRERTAENAIINNVKISVFAIGNTILKKITKSSPPSTYTASA